MAIDFEYSPHFIFRNRHFQTIFSNAFRNFPPIPEAEEWLVPLHSVNAFDSNFSLRGKYWPGDRAKKLAILYHGLGGDADSATIVGLAMSLHSAGYHVLRMNLRGSELAPPYTPTLYHCGLTEDIDATMQSAFQRGFRKIYIFGMSLSANKILKWLGEAHRPVLGALLTSPPVRLQSAANRLDLPENKIYQTYFLRKLRVSLHNKAEKYPYLFKSFLRPEVFASIQGFDELVTAPFYGFQGASEYYEKCSSYRLIHKIQNSTVIVHSLDDPIVDANELKEMSPKLNDNVQIRLFETGGHVGFFEGLQRGYKLERWVLHYFNSLS